MHFQCFINPVLLFYTLVVFKSNHLKSKIVEANFQTTPFSTFERCNPFFQLLSGIRFISHGKQSLSFFLSFLFFTKTNFFAWNSCSQVSNSVHVIYFPGEETILEIRKSVSPLVFPFFFYWNLFNRVRVSIQT